MLRWHHAVHLRLIIPTRRKSERARRPENPELALPSPRLRVSVVKVPAF